MTPISPASQARKELARREITRRAARKDPRVLLDRVVCVDAKSGDKFRFDFDGPWAWQGELLDWWLENPRSLILKARQLGVTWLACALALWIILTKPGARVLAVSINEAEAAKLVNRIWDMHQSLPVWLRYGTKVLFPAKGARPSTKIELQHPDGRISAVIGLPSTPKAGHGETAALVILDEFSRQEYAADTWKAVVPTAADTSEDSQARVLVISTANGVSNEQTGAGNRFHHLWVNQQLYGLAVRFLGWRSHPGRTQAWYESLPLTVADKAEQYPDTPEEAFILSGDMFFDKEALLWYSKERKKQALYRMRFTRKTARAAVINKERRGAEPNDPGPIISVYREPEEAHEYAVFCDVATGKGRDYSAAYVIDLSDMAFCAEVHSKLDEDLYAYQLHYLGKWYEDALVAIETGGGYGNTVITLLRDGKEGRPPYPRLYRYREEVSTELKERRNWGFPMTSATRPLVINGLEKALRERSLPWVTQGLLDEMTTFVRKDTNPSPRAEDGTNDDRVMAAGGALEIYRRYGHHADRPRKRRTRKILPSYPW